MKLAACVLVVGAVALTAGAGLSSARSDACPTTNDPNELILVGGSKESAQLGKQFQSPFQVQLANTNGCPLTGDLAGAPVEFVAPGSGPSGVFASTGNGDAVVGTDAQGVATAPPFTANDTAGFYSVVAHSVYGDVNVDLDNTASGLPAAIAAVAGSGQAATVDAQYTQALQVRVTDAGGTPVQGATVSYAIVPGPAGATATFLGGGPADAVTDSNGIATAPPLLAGPSPGAFTVVASTDGLASVATFALDSHAGALRLTASTTTHPRATVEARFSALRVRVLDGSGNPVEGASVTFAVDATAGGAGASFVGAGAQAVALTGTDGVATSPALLASSTAGTFTVTAAAAGARTVVFTLTNVAARATSIAVGAASGSSTTLGARFPVPLAVTVTDKAGNPVAHARVVFTAPKRGASGRFTHGRRRVTVSTGAKGVAVAPRFTANRTPGGFAVTARVAGTSARAAFALVNAPR